MWVPGQLYRQRYEICGKNMLRVRYDFKRGKWRWIKIGEIFRG